MEPTPVVLSLRCIGAALLVGVLAATPAQAGVVDYLYMESNEGGSSGGHVALRVDDRVYDFQNHSPGVLRLNRRDAGDFLYAYAFLQNRPIHGLRLSLKDSDAAQLREHFNGLFLAQEAQFRALEVLTEDARLLEALASADTAESSSMSVAGAGYFFGRDGTSSRIGTSSALRELRERVEKKFGSGWIETRIDEERLALRAIRPRVVVHSDLTTQHAAYPNVHSAFSERYRKQLGALTALEVLRDRRSVLESATVVGESSEFDLSAEQIRRLATFASGQLEQILLLLSSARKDSGSDLLIGMARLDVLERSIRSGRLQVLDVFPQSAPTLGFAVVRGSGALPNLVADAREDAAEARRGWAEGRSLSGAPAEGGDSSARRGQATQQMLWGEVEISLNRLQELREVESEQRDLRVGNDGLFPEKSAELRAPVATATAPGTFASLADQARGVQRWYESELFGRWDYDLLGRNCVTELLSTMEQGTDSAVRGSRTRRRASSGAQAIPVLSTTFVREHYPVEHSFRIPSWREQRITSLKEQGGSLETVALRESNTITSQVYRPTLEDSSFLFFADSVAVRPLVGAVNLVAAGGATAAAIATMPWRGFEPLRAGLRGMLFSLPELAFQGIRKGTFVYVDRRELSAPPQW